MSPDAGDDSGTPACAEPGAPEVRADRQKATLGDLVAELKRRRVFRVLVGYGLFSFAVLQVVEPVIHGAHLPDWVLTATLFSLAVGLPVALILAWLFDLTAAGVKRTPSSPESGGIQVSRGRLAALLFGVGLLGALPGVAWYAWREGVARKAASAAPVAGASIAVLPFADLSPDHDQDYFSDGVAEEILTALSKVEGLRVPGRASSFFFKGKNVEPREIALRLGVSHLLEGSVRRSGNKLRITTEVVKATDGERLWSQTFDRELTDVFAIQDEIARAVVEALRVKLLPGQGSLVATKRPTHPEAYRLYLLGRHLLARDNQKDDEAAVHALREAVRLDPAFIPARAWLTRAIVQRYDIGSSDPAKGMDPAFGSEVIPAALRAADEIIGLDPSVAEGYSLRGYLRNGFTWEWAGALEDYRRALSISPGDAQTRVDYARTLASVGRLPEALEVVQTVAATDPLLSDAYRWLGVWQAATGDPEKAEATYRRGLEVAPGQPYLLRELGYAYLLLGKVEAALDLFGRNPVEWMRLTGVALATHQLGHDAESRAAIDQLRSRTASGFVPWYQLGEIHAWRGEKDLAFRWLEEAYSRHDPGLCYIRYDPLLRSIRADPRYAALLEKLKLSGN